MYYTVYKITNLINNKIYIGVHKTKDINDDYMGSGKYLKRAIEKYGIENFRKEILKVYDNPEDMFNMESTLVNEDFVKDKETYNLKVGGEGGWDYINNLENSRDYKIKGGLASKRFYDSNAEALEKKVNQLFKSVTFESLSKGGKKSTGFTNKKHSIKTKKLISEKQKVNTKGEKNSQFGTMWIHNLEEKRSKKIKKEELQDYEKLGWLKGRKMKFDKEVIKI